MALWKPWKEILWPFPRRGRIQTVWCTLFSNMSCTASVGRTTFVINLLITHTRMFSGNNLNKVLIESNIHDKPYKKKYISRKSSKKFTLLLISDYWGAGDLGQNGDNQYYAVIGCWSSELMHIVQWADSSSNTFLSHFFKKWHRIWNDLICWRSPTSPLSIYCDFPWKLCRDSISKPIIQIFRSLRRDGKLNILIHAIVRIWKMWKSWYTHTETT